jgi:hypothetical protein
MTSVPIQNLFAILTSFPPEAAAPEASRWRNADKIGIGGLRVVTGF